MIFLSPGVKTREVDYSTYVGQASSCIVGMIGGASKGPIEEPTLCTSPANFQEIFGEPISDDFGSYAALEFLKQGNQLYYLRVAGDDCGYATTTLSNGLIIVTAKEKGTYYERHHMGAMLTKIDGDIARIVIYKDNVQEETIFVSLKEGNPNYKFIEDTSVSRWVTFELAELSNAQPEIISPNSGFVTSGGYPVVINGLTMNMDSPAFLTIENALGIEPTCFVANVDNKWEIIGGDNPMDGGSPKFSPAPLAGPIEYIYLHTNIPVAVNACKVEILWDGAYRDGTNPNGPDPTLMGGSSATATSPALGDYPIDGTGCIAGYGDIEPLPPVNGVVPNGIRISFKNLAKYNLGLNNGTDDWVLRLRVILTSATGIQGYEELILKSFAGANHSLPDYTIPDAASMGSSSSIGIGPTATGNTVPKGDYTVSKDISYLLGGNDGTPIDTQRIIGSNGKGLQLFRNVEEMDVNILAAPGHYDAAVQAELINICETRADCMAVLDPPQGLSRSDMIKYHNGELDGDSYPKAPLASSYAAIYYPWVQIYDTFSGENKWVPPSGVVCGAYAYNDNVGQPWFAPAGLNRGMLSSVIATEVALDEGSRDDLYGNGNCVNAIVNYKRQGITIWGQRTLLRKNSALDRVNVRRLLNITRKAIAASTAYLIFEQNDELTWRRWVGTITPYLESIKASRGLYDFRVVMDETTVTPYYQDKNEMPGKIFLKPTKTAEFIPVDFILTTSGASFSDFE